MGNCVPKRKEDENDEQKSKCWPRRLLKRIKFKRSATVDVISHISTHDIAMDTIQRVVINQEEIPKADNIINEKNKTTSSKKDDRQVWEPTTSASLSDVMETTKYHHSPLAINKSSLIAIVACEDSSLKCKDLKVKKGRQSNSACNVDQAKEDRHGDLACNDNQANTVGHNSSDDQTKEDRQSNSECNDDTSNKNQPYDSTFNVSKAKEDRQSNLVHNDEKEQEYQQNDSACSDNRATQYRISDSVRIKELASNSRKSDFTSYRYEYETDSSNKKSDSALIVAKVVVSQSSGSVSRKLTLEDVRSKTYQRQPHLNCNAIPKYTAVANKSRIENEAKPIENALETSLDRVKNVIADSLVKIADCSPRADCIFTTNVRGPSGSEPRMIPIRATAKQIKDGTAKKLIIRSKVVTKKQSKCNFVKKYGTMGYKRHVGKLPKLALKPEVPKVRWKQKKGPDTNVVLQGLPTFYEPPASKSPNPREKLGLPILMRYNVGLQCKAIERIKWDEQEFPGLMPPRMRKEWLKKKAELRASVTS